MSYEGPRSYEGLVLKKFNHKKTVPVKLLTKQLQDNFLVPWINKRKSIDINHAHSVYLM